VRVCFFFHFCYFFGLTPDELQAYLVLHEGYIPEKHHTNQMQSPLLKQCISWGLGG